MTRESNGTTADKTAGFNAKPVSVVLNGNQIEAQHHITSANNRLLHLYIESRTGGIDVTVPLCSDKPAYARSDRGKAALGIGTDDEEPRLVADGGQRVGRYTDNGQRFCSECGDPVDDGLWCSDECKDEYWDSEPDLGTRDDDEEVERYNHATGRWH